MYHSQFLVFSIIDIFFFESSFFFYFFCLNLFIILGFSIYYLLHNFFFFRVPEKEFLKAFKNHPRLKTKVNNFHRQMASVNTSDEDFVAIRPEWTTVDRILACRFNWEFIFLFPHMQTKIRLFCS